jgi:hypothetical protein
MAGSKSNWLEVQVLDHLLGRATTELSTGAHANLYVGLWETTAAVQLSDTSVGNSSGECGGSTYARVAVANSSANWENSTAGAKQNKTVIEFTTAAGSDWGQVGQFAILSSGASSGNILYWGDLTSDQTISSGNVVQFSAGAIDITED